jgi:hypothetical protein
MELVHIYAITGLELTDRLQFVRWDTGAVFGGLCVQSRGWHVGSGFEGCEVS